MSAMPIALSHFGLVTGVGLNAPATCAAIRCAIDNFQETRFMDNGGEWIMGCEVALKQPWRGKIKLIKMAAMAIRESLEQERSIDTEKTPLILCLAEPNRVGRVIDDDNLFFHDLCAELELTFHDKSRVIAQGHVGLGAALTRARKLLQESSVNQVLICGVDSLLVAATLMDLQDRERLLTSNNSDGFIPGEGAGAVLVTSLIKTENPQYVCTGVGFGVETATVDSEEPLRAEGLVAAIRQALHEANCEMGSLDFRITDVTGEQYAFKEAALAMARLLRTRKKEFDIWHPADCIGETGSAAGLVMLSHLNFAFRKEFSKGGNVLLQLAEADGKRVAVTLAWRVVG